jgi:hypothetical protein
MTVKKEMLAIPGWAFVVAALLFVVIPILFFTFAFRGGESGPRFLPFVILISVVPGTILAFLTIMVGYVNRDAGLRGMNRTLWTLLVIFVPNAIGFILYFLLRNPIQLECPKCSAMVDPRANFCPRCQHSFHPLCSQCRSAVRASDEFCANCGAKTDQVA